MYHTGNQLVDPYIVFQKAHLQPGMHIADFGCGRTGHIVFPAAPIIGEHGVIYAVDIMKDVLSTITKRAQLEGLLNIHTVWSDIEQIGHTAIPEKSLDAVLIVNSLFHAADKTHMLGEAKRLLKDKGRIVVVDWRRSDLPFGPNQKELIDFAMIKQWGAENNFVMQDEFDLGRYHHGVVLYKHE